MDELLRALARKYRAEPNSENADRYINSLERTQGGIADSGALYNVWGSLVLGLFDPEGVNTAVFDSLHDLTLLLFGEEAATALRGVITSSDGAFFIEEESWFEDFLRRIGYICQPCEGCDSSNVGGHAKCNALTPSGNLCKCPGCYKLNDHRLCWHHFQMMESSPRMGYQINFAEDAAEDTEYRISCLECGIPIPDPGSDADVDTAALFCDTCYNQDDA